MPTGYTAGIMDGTTKTFKDFATQCLRAFGATIHMRDEPMDKPYEPRVPSAYDQKAIEKDTAEIEVVKNMNDAELIASHKAGLQKNIEYHTKGIDDKKRNGDRLKGMLKDAEAFIPPTPTHEEIKAFMIKQIKDTIDFDCSGTYYEDKLAEIEKEMDLPADEIRFKRLESLYKSLAYHQKNLREDIKRCNDSNEYVEQFLKALN